MASLARQLALRSRLLAHAQPSSAPPLSQVSRRALARYYSSKGRRPPPKAQSAQKDAPVQPQARDGSTAGGAENLSPSSIPVDSVAPDSYREARAASQRSRDAFDLERDLESVLSLVEDSSYIASVNKRFQAAFSTHSQDLPLHIKAKMLVDLSEGREPTAEDDVSRILKGVEAGKQGSDLAAYNARFPRDIPLPNLSEPVPIYDLKETLHRPATADAPYPSTVTIRNDPSMFIAQGEWKPEDPSERKLYEEEQAAYAEEMEDNASKEDDGEEAPEDSMLREAEELKETIVDEEGAGKEGQDEDEFVLPWSSGEETDNTIATRKVLSLSDEQLRRLHIYTLMSRRVVQQTHKGKQARNASLIVVGNGDGLVGYGYAKSGSDTPSSGHERAFIQAVRSMDYVDRFEDRTIWTEMQDKMGATRIILRPRPAGFGLHCNPYIHQICKAAGIKDISAKVWGSRTPINVIKLCFRMLQSGNAPQAMGNGIGGPGRKLDKGSGMRGKDEIQRERGRKILSLRVR